MSSRNDNEDVQRLIQPVEDKRAELVQTKKVLAGMMEWLKFKEQDFTCIRLLCENTFASMQDCESTMKSLYGSLGMKYRDEDMEEEGIESQNLPQTSGDEEERNESSLALLGDGRDTLVPMIEDVSVAIQMIVKLVQDLAVTVGYSSRLSDLSSRASTASTSTACYSATPGHAQLSNAPVCDKPVPGQEREEIVLEVGTKVLAKSGAQVWSRGTVQHVTEEGSARSYTVEFQEQHVKVVPAHHVAEDKTPLLKDLFVGCRVVASYKDEKKKNCFNAGVMAELPERRNRMRFLVFYDDNTVAYLALPDFTIVCKQLESVWTEIEDEALQEQVKDYLSTYPDTKRLQLIVGQEFKILRNGETETCEVMECDGSLVRLRYKKDQMMEWVYTGTIISKINPRKRAKPSQSNPKSQNH